MLLVLGRRKGMRGAALLLLLCPLARVVIVLFIKSWINGIGMHFETVADALATGCLLAGANEWLKSNLMYRRFTASRWFALVPFIVLATQFALSNQIKYYFLAYILIGQTVMNIGIAMCIDWSINNNSGKIGKILNSMPFIFIGQLSYSLYLWQEIFLYKESPLSIPVALLLILGSASVSYYLIEKPFLNIRQKLESKIFRRSDLSRVASLTMLDNTTVR